MVLKAKTLTRASQAKSEALIEVAKERNVRLNANIPESLYKALKVKAAQEDQKINDLVIKWVNEFLSK
jgi:predicted HicB family RNase H-like nuclease